jgi:hypothetical protein
MSDRSIMDDRTSDRTRDRTSDRTSDQTRHRTSGQIRSSGRSPVQGDGGVFFTDSIDVCAVAGIGDALYRTYDCPATGCGGHGPGDHVVWLVARAGLRGRD